MESLLRAFQWAQDEHRTLSLSLLQKRALKRSVYNLNRSSTVKLSSYVAQKRTVNLNVKSSTQDLWRKITAITAFKVSQGHRFWYDFLLVINTNLDPILHRFQVMAD